MALSHLCPHPTAVTLGRPEQPVQTPCTDLLLSDVVGQRPQFSPQRGSAARLPLPTGVPRSGGTNILIGVSARAPTQRTAHTCSRA